MRHSTQELRRKSAAFHERFKDRELDEYLESLARDLEEAENLHAQLGHLLKHVRANVAYTVQPRHLRDAVDRSERFLKRIEAEAN